MPKHIVILLLLLGCFILIALAAKLYLTDPSFYQYGHYRADAVVEIAAQKSLYQGAAYCQTCHEQRHADWLIGVHKTVQCEVCHGTVEDHPDDGLILTPADTIRLCTNCHEAMSARPAWQPQIILAEHDEDSEPCQSCHDPHSPGDAESTATDIAAQVSVGSQIDIRAVKSKCAKCHGKQGEGKKKNPALAGLEFNEFIKRINEYKTDPDKSKKMTKYVKSLSADEIAELAAYYERLPVETPE